MTPAELDIILNGAFIYRGANGLFASFNFKLRDFGFELVRRSGRLSEEDLRRPASDVLATINEALNRAAA